MIIFYSTHCPKCNVLEKKLKDKGVEYTEINDIKVMLNKGIASVPVLEIEGVFYDFKQAVEWIRKQD